MSDRERSNGDGGGRPGLLGRLWPRVNGGRRDTGPDERCLEGKRVPHTPSCDPDCDAVPLEDLRVGERGTVSCLDHPGGLDARKLAAMGILPGTDVEILQRSPAFVLRIGYSDFAVDAELARRIRVRRDASGAEDDPREDPPSRGHGAEPGGPAP